MTERNDYLYTSVCRKESDVHQMLDAMIDNSDMLNNYGQAVKYCIRTTAQREDMKNEL